jgi:parallel beta-helix repeat protein
MCLLILILGLFSINAQPSGGPYGPIGQNYEIPKTGGKIYYVAPDGKSEVEGAQLSNPTSIENALSKVKTGDVIILRGGTYRTGDLQFNQEITIQPYADELPVFKGTFEAKDWKNIGHGLWKTSWEKLFPGAADDWWYRDGFGKSTPLHLFNNDMVFIDGKLLNSAGWEGEVNENSFYVDYANKSIYIGCDPTNKLVEITAFYRGLQRVINDCNGKVSDKKGFVLRGVVFTQYAYCALEIDGFEPQKLADPSGFGKDVVGTVIENCTLSYCGRVGAYLRGDNLVLRHCEVHHTTTEGIYLLSSSDCLIEKNKFSQNNIENIDGYYPAAVKIFNQTYRVTCRDNLVFDLPLSNGIWYDVGNVDGRFINNWVKDVGTNKGKMGDVSKMWPNYNGFFFEISKNAICAGNVFENCDQGIMVLNSSNVEVYQNTFVNSTAWIGRDTRSAAAGDLFGWHPSTGPDVDARYGHVFINNLLVGDENFSKPLMQFQQHKDLCGKLKDSQIKVMDYNVYVKNPANNNKQLVLWSPSETENCEQIIESLSDLQKVFKGSSNNSLYINKPNLTVFISPELGNYQLIKDFQGAKTATQLPEKIQKLLGLPAKYNPFTGAYLVK